MNLVVKRRIEYLTFYTKILFIFLYLKLFETIFSIPVLEQFIVLWFADKTFLNNITRPLKA
jgi:hypothetical protein